MSGDFCRDAGDDAGGEEEGGCELHGKDVVLLVVEEL